MGFDIKSFTDAFIKNAEKLINGENNPNNDGVLDASEKKALPSVFARAFEQTKTEVGGAPEGFDIGSVMGLEKTGAAEASQGAKAPRRAGEGDGGDGGEGGGTTNPINIDVTIPINIKINIPMNMTMDVQGAGIDVDALVEILKKYLDESQTNQTNVLMAFIQELWNSFSSTLGDGLKDLLEKILKRFDEQDKTMEMMYKQLMANISNSVKAILDSLNRLGVKISNLENLVKDYHKEEIDVLLDIYSKLDALKDAISSLSEEQKKSFMNVLNKLGDMELSLNNINSLLAVIQADTTENKKISLKILEQIEQGKTEILTAIANLGDNITTYGDKILKMLENIDIDKIGQKLDDIKALLEVIDTTTKDTNKDTKQIKEDTAAILELLKDFPDFVSTIKELIEKMDGKLDKIREFLEQMEANNVERHDVVTAKLDYIKELIEKLGPGPDLTKIMDALAILQGDVNDIKITLSNIEDLCNQILEKIPTIDLTEIRNLLLSVRSYQDEYYTNLKTQIESLNPGDWSQFEEKIQNMIDAGIAVVINDLSNLINEKCDFGPIMDKLDKILDAIKNHKVEVTVDIDDIRIIDADGNEQTVRFTYVNCFPDEGEHAAARRAPGAVTPEQAREYELLLNFGKTSEAELDEKEQDILAKADANPNRPKVSGDTSGIEGVETEQKQSRPGVYTLGGVYVGADRSSITRPGVYIIDGKKVSIK